ncbi:hypothetical protein ACQPZK_18840 [Micromonospora sp. CA-249363]|jgi:hypothetical protein|uniref:hypothetical protein n=1 Tax=Micromonospora sp. CA-249363 TaxID=3239963 RepID=UPI003D930495
MTIRMISADGGRHVLAEQPADLLAELIGGYARLPSRHRRAARVAHAQRSLARIRQRLAAGFGPDAVPPTVLVDVQHDAADGRHRDDATIWLDTEDDERYLRSLAVAGEIVLTVGEGHSRGMSPDFAGASGDGDPTAPVR